MKAAEIEKIQTPSFTRSENGFFYASVHGSAIEVSAQGAMAIGAMAAAAWLKEIAYQLAVFNEGMARLCSETKPGVADEQIHLKVQIDERQA